MSLIESLGGHTQVRRKLAIAAIVSGVMLAVTACSSTSSPDKGGAVSIALYQKPALFSPLETPNGPDQVVMSLIFDSLLGVDGDFKLQPHLAEAKPQISDGGKTLTFKLRQGLNWSDGKPFSSKDVLFTFKTLSDPASKNAGVGKFANITSVEAPDDHTFVIHTKNADTGVLALVGPTPILPEHILGKVPMAELSSNVFFRNPTVGMGAYKFVTYKTDQYVELDSNSFARTPAKISKLYLKILTSDLAASSLASGEVDLAQVSPTDLSAVEKNRHVKVEKAESPGYLRIAINLDQKRFKDKRVRQAFMYAIDRNKIIKTVLGGNATAPNSSFYGAAYNSSATDYSYDPAKAKSLLTSAGWDFSKSVDLAWIPGQRDRDTAVTIIQSQLASLGVKVNIKQQQASELTDSYNNSPRKFDFVLYGGGNYATDPYAILPIEGCDQFTPTGGNVPHFCNQDFDGLMNDANAETDASKRQELYREAATIESDEVPYLWLYNPTTIWAHNNRIEGFKPSGDVTNGFWNAASWSIK